MHLQVAASAGRNVSLVLDFDAFTAKPSTSVATVSPNWLITTKQTMCSRFCLRVIFAAPGFHEALVSQLFALPTASHKASHGDWLMA